MNKSIFQVILMFSIISIIVSSCTTLRIEKRLYRKGLNVQIKNNTSSEKYIRNNFNKNLLNTESVINLSNNEVNRIEFNNQDEVYSSLNNEPLVLQNKSKVSLQSNLRVKQNDNIITSKYQENNINKSFKKSNLVNDEDEDKVMKRAKKAVLYFFLGFIPYAGAYFATVALILAISALRHADESKDPAKVRKLTRWIVIFNIIFLTLFLGLLALFIFVL
ncbi:MAG: hypothetical protein A2046_01930 [Bacteroidetes bacterium GWA2_30_7]|nr:MAG: hypothetical protein A2046_01930 [Bacteroidetes bacterium GWA2_30_7]